MRDTPLGPADPQKVESSPSLLEVEPRAFRHFFAVLDRSIDKLAEKVVHILSRHPGLYDESFALIAKDLGKQPDDIRGIIAGYFEIVLSTYRSAPPLVARLSKGDPVEAEFKVPANIFSTVKLDTCGEYRVRLTFEAPQRTNEDVVNRYTFQPYHGHFFQETTPYSRTTNETKKLWESLGAIDGAPPFLSERQLQEVARPMTVERVYLLACTGFLSAKPNPEGGTALWVQNYYIQELKGTDLEAKLHDTLQFFSTPNPGNSRLTQMALPEGSRSASVSCKGLKLSIEGRRPSRQDFYDLMRSGKEDEWTLLQSKSRPTFNEECAYVAIRRSSELVVPHQGEPILAQLGNVISHVSEPMCENKRGSFEVLANLGQLIEAPSTSPRFDPDEWEIKSPEELA